MVCNTYGNVIICGPPRGVYKRIAEHDCPECETRHRFVQQWDGAWYGVTLYGSCGDSWADGYRGYRPFRRYWRRDAQASFEQMWEHAAPTDLYDAYIQADCDMACGDGDDLEDAIARRQAAHDAILASRAEAGVL